jgi:hypothetical protein
MFIEFQNYFTGLLHKTEFSNYAKETAGFESGKEIDFYIKDIVLKKGEPRIILTTGQELINQDKLMWQALKDRTVNKEHEFEFNKDNNVLTIFISGTSDSFNMDVSHLKGKMKIASEGLLTITEVDIIKNNIKFDFSE